MCSIQFTVIPWHKGAQTGLAVLPRNEEILVYHNDTPDSYPSASSPMWEYKTLQRCETVARTARTPITSG